MMQVFHKLMRHSSLIIFGLCACVVIPGCTTTGMLSKLSFRKENPKATAANPAVRILCMWQPADGVGVDDKPARGVAGQIFFFTRNNVTPVEVDGDVRIFLFDDQGSETQQGMPLHEFDFVKGAWNAQLVNTQFGPAYQLFVPYSRKGRHQAELAVRVRLTPLNGPTIFSDMSKVSLPGYDNKHDEEQPSVVATETTSNAGGQLAVGKTAAPADSGSPTNLSPEQIQQVYLQILAERNNSAPNPSPRSTRTHTAEPSARPATLPSTTISSVVGRIQVDSNGHNVIASNDELDDEPPAGNKLLKRTSGNR